MRGGGGDDFAPRTRGLTHEGAAPISSTSQNWTTHTMGDGRIVTWIAHEDGTTGHIQDATIDYGNGAQITLDRKNEPFTHQNIISRTDAAKTQNVEPQQFLKDVQEIFADPQEQAQGRADLRTQGAGEAEIEGAIRQMRELADHVSGIELGPVASPSAKPNNNSQPPKPGTRCGPNMRCGG